MVKLISQVSGRDKKNLLRQVRGDASFPHHMIQKHHLILSLPI